MPLSYIAEQQVAMIELNLYFNFREIGKHRRGLGACIGLRAGALQMFCVDLRQAAPGFSRHHGVSAP